MNDDTLFDIEKEMAVLVRYLTFVTNKRIGNLDRSAYLLLQQLSNQGPAGVKTISAVLLLDVSTVSRQAAALEQKGYVEKVPDEHDGRAYFYRITKTGSRELDLYKQITIERVANLLQEWSAEERRQFGELLKKFNQSIKNRD
ncbi:MarR family winged helix-turn-helix transcriptional regulator [Paenibacillus illinoisensis]|uniref:MarR family winged helix-turn-helix transcriptional regulator n=1 Tax=Paenibacillus illinoisensis TaxID=59845 RepID=UPI000FD722CE|nr:MarR family transcriptional regulator [Paenibacillus illinoisensis]